MKNSKQHIIESLPDIIRLDKTFDEFSKATGFDLHGFNDAVIIRKKDLVCLTTDRVVTDSLLKTIFNSLLASVNDFYIKTNSGYHQYKTFPLDNSKNPFGDPNKAKLYGLARSGHVGKQPRFKA